jgi:hypothetical protein
LKTRTRFNPESSHFSFFQENMYLDSSSVSETWFQVQFFKQIESNSGSNFENQTQFRIESYKPKWAFFTRQSGLPSQHWSKPWSKRKYKKCEKSAEKELDEHNPFMESIKAFFFFFFKITSIYVHICMGLLKYPWQEKTWHKQSCSRTFVAVNRLLSFLTPVCVCVLVSLSRLLLQAHLFIWKWETKPDSICCCFP